MKYPTQWNDVYKWKYNLIFNTPKVQWQSRMLLFVVHCLSIASLRLIILLHIVNPRYCTVIVMLSALTVALTCCPAVFYVADLLLNGSHHYVHWLDRRLGAIWWVNIICSAYNSARAACCWAPSGCCMLLQWVSSACTTTVCTAIAAALRCVLYLLYIILLIGMLVQAIVYCSLFIYWLWHAPTQ